MILYSMTRDTLVVPVQTVEAGLTTSRLDLLAVEEPLEIHLNARPLSITMRTPGDDLDLVAGFLFTEGVADVASIRQDSDNLVLVCLKEGVEPDLSRLERNYETNSSCGICGKVSIEALAIKPRQPFLRDEPNFASGVIDELPAALRRSQEVFERTGGLHAAALFSVDGTLIALREDVGRHNAVDKLVGFAVRTQLPLQDKLIFVSGRAGFELIQKAIVAGIPILAAVGAPSSLAVSAAQRFGMTLLGFVRSHRFNIYSGAWRIR